MHTCSVKVRPINLSWTCLCKYNTKVITVYFFKYSLQGFFATVIQFLFRVFIIQPCCSVKSPCYEVKSMDIFISLVFISGNCISCPLNLKLEYVCWPSQSYWNFFTIFVFIAIKNAWKNVLSFIQLIIQL